MGIKEKFKKLSRKYKEWGERDTPVTMILDIRSNRKVNSKDLAKFSVKGKIIDCNNRTISGGGNCLHVTHPRGWLDLMLTRKNPEDSVKTYLVQDEVRNRHMIIITPLELEL